MVVLKKRLLLLTVIVGSAIACAIFIYVKEKKEPRVELEATEILTPKYGFYVTPLGNKIIVEGAQECRFFTEGLAAVRIESKYGYVDLRGRLAVPAIFDECRIFSEGVAGVRKGGDDWVLIDRLGNVVADLSAFDDVGVCREGLVPVRKGEMWGFIDRAGSLVITPAFSRVLPFSGDGVASCSVSSRTGERWGLVSHDGNWIVSPNFDKPLITRSGQFWTAKDGRMVVVDVAGSTHDVGAVKQ